MRFFILSLLLLASVASFGAEGKVEIRFLADRISAEHGAVTLATKDARSTPFNLPMNNLSAPQTPPARLFSIWSEKQNLSLATINLPDEGDSFIALLVTSPDKAGYTAVVMPYRNPKFKVGDICFLNLSDNSVLGYVGTSKFILEAGKSQIVTPEGAREAKFYDVGLGVREPDGDKLLATTRWPESKLTRYYVFFYVDPKTHRTTFRGVDEFMAPEQPTP